MKDPRRVAHPAPPGLPSAAALPAVPHAVVVGAGIAGLAAATGLIERGVTVEVIAREPNLGGRVAGSRPGMSLSHRMRPSTHSIT